MGAWLRWPAALVPGKEAQEAVFGTASATTRFWHVTSAMMLVATGFPAALLLTKRDQALRQESPFQ